MFSVLLFRNNSEPNRLNKIPYNQLIMTATNVTLKNSTSIYNPVLLLSTNDSGIYTCNYCYITAFGKYYYITDIIFVNNNLYEIYCKLDVLCTYRNEIRDCEFHVMRTSNERFCNKDILDSLNSPIKTGFNVTEVKKIDGFLQSNASRLNRDSNQFVVSIVKTKNRLISSTYDGFSGGNINNSPFVLPEGTVRGSLPSVNIYLMSQNEYEELRWLNNKYGESAYQQVFISAYAYGFDVINATLDGGWYDTGGDEGVGYGDATEIVEVDLPYGDDVNWEEFNTAFGREGTTPFRCTRLKQQVCNAYGDFLTIDNFPIDTTIVADRVYNDYRDFEPYTNFTLYLPYYGNVSLPAVDVYTNNLRVGAVFNLDNGSMTYFIYYPSINNNKPKIVGIYDVTIGTLVPISYSNNMDRERLIAEKNISNSFKIARSFTGIGESAANGFAQAASGGFNPISTAQGAMTAISGTVDSVFGIAEGITGLVSADFLTPSATVLAGSGNDNIKTYLPQDFILYKEELYTKNTPTEIATLYGYCADYYGVLTEFSDGDIVFAMTNHLEIEGATPEHISEIESYFQNGVIL